MNLIVLMIDTLRQDHIGVYHRGKPPFEDVPAARTPAIDAFAGSSIVFTNAYPEGLPTIPVRYTLMTGQCSLPFRPWAPLQAGELTMAQVLRSEGYVCGLVSDCYHYRAPGMNYHTGFHAYRWIRGQEYDPWESAPSKRSVEAYVNGNYTEEWRQRVAQFLANTDALESEEDRFPSQVVDEAIEWLRRNRVHKKIFLWVDCFDPHEPWDPPARFDTYTDKRYSGPRLIMPMGGFSNRWASPDEARFIRGLYAGEVAFVDSCMGRLLAALEEMGYLDDSIVVILSDHGHPLNDHGKFLKGADRMYGELLNVPFIVRLPGGKGAGGRHDALIQFQDLLPTLFDIMGLGANADAMHGRSFRGVIEGRTSEHRSATVTGYFEGIDRCIRTKEWSYIERPAGQQDELYNLREDPRERTNLIESHPEEAERLARAFGRYYRPRRKPRSEIQGKYELAGSGLEEPTLG